MNGDGKEIFLVVFIIRKELFSVSYWLYNLNFSDDENRIIFGKCNNENGYGYNYLVKVIVCGFVDLKIGMVINLIDLKKYMKSVLEFLDYRNLDIDVLYFRNVCLMVENIFVYVWDWLVKFFLEGEGLFYEVKVKEIDKNLVFYIGEWCNKY